MTENIKPCPFCGELPGISQDENAYEDGIFWTVECMNEDCRVYVKTVNFNTKGKAIEAWNIRIPSPVDTRER
jgi:hypothetical protein